MIRDLTRLVIQAVGKLPQNILGPVEQFIHKLVVLVCMGLLCLLEESDGPVVAHEYEPALVRRLDLGSLVCLVAVNVHVHVGPLPIASYYPYR